MCSWSVGPPLNAVYYSFFGEQQLPPAVISCQWPLVCRMSTCHIPQRLGALNSRDSVELCTLSLFSLSSPSLLPLAVGSVCLHHVTFGQWWCDGAVAIVMLWPALPKKNK